MICPNCGNNVEDGIYCPNCGATVEEKAEAQSEFMEVTKAPESKAVGEAKKKKKKVLTPEEQAARKKLIKKLIVGGAFWLFAINMISLAIIIGVLAINNPAYTVLRYLEDGYFYSAENTFEYDMNGRANKKLIEGLDERLDEIWENYQNNNYTSYDDIEEELETIENMGITEISEKLDSTIAQVEALHDSREAFEDGQWEEDYDDYMEAITYYSQVISTDSNYEAAQERIKALTPLYREEIFEEIDEYLEYGYYTSAFEVIAAAKKALPKDAEITKKLTECENVIIAKVDEHISKLRYDDAIELIEFALEGYPEDEALNTKLTELESGRPIMLKSLAATKNSKCYTTDTYTFEDANGVEHDGKFRLDPGMDEKKLSIVEVELKGEYTKFSANFAPEKSTNEEENFTIEIRVDGKAVKTIKGFTNKSKNEAVEIDITGAQTIEIRVKSQGENNFNYIAMTEACVYK